MKIIRLITAILGGYLLSSLLTISLTLVLPFSNKAESVVLASMLSFTFWLLFILYSYSSISIKKTFNSTYRCFYPAFFNKQLFFRN